MFGLGYSRVAVESGAVNLTACQLRRIAGGWTVHRLATLEDPLRDDAASNERLRLERAARLVHQSGFYGREAVIALSPPDVAFFPARVPDTLAGAPRAQWLTLLRFEAARQAQCPPDSLEVDFWPLPPGNRMGDNVLIVSVPQPVLQRCTDFCRSIGLQLARVDVAPCALLRALQRHAAAPAPASNTMWGILDIGHAHSTLTVGVDHSAVYVRPLTTSGTSYTHAVAHALGLDFQTAELLKRRYNAAAAPAGQAAAVATAAAEPAAARPRRWSDEVSNLADVLAPLLQARNRLLAAEVERAFGYVLEAYPAAAHGRLYLCGGGGRLAGLDCALTEFLGLEAVSLGCAGVTGLRGDPQSLARLSPQCLGLAMGDLL